VDILGHRSGTHTIYPCIVGGLAAPSASASASVGTPLPLRCGQRRYMESCRRIVSRGRSLNEASRTGDTSDHREVPSVRGSGCFVCLRISGYRTFPDNLAEATCDRATAAACEHRIRSPCSAAWWPSVWCPRSGR
jgi:hypothetical protein